MPDHTVEVILVALQQQAHLLSTQLGGRPVIISTGGLAYHCFSSLDWPVDRAAQITVPPELQDAAQLGTIIAKTLAPGIQELLFGPKHSFLNYLTISPTTGHIVRRGLRSSLREQVAAHYERRRCRGDLFAEIPVVKRGALIHEELRRLYPGLDEVSVCTIGVSCMEGRAFFHPPQGLLVGLSNYSVVREEEDTFTIRATTHALLPSIDDCLLMEFTD